VSKTILVTGANGFVGSNLVDFLLNQGDQVIALDFIEPAKADNLRALENHSGFEYCPCDIRHRDQVMALADRKIDLVYHLASVVGVRHYMNDPMTLIDVIVLGTRHMIEFCRATGARMVFTSTSEIYGRNPEIPWDEDADRVVGSTRVDRWSYSSSKGVCEHMLFANYRYDEFPFSTARFFNVYGPRQSPIYIVSQTIHRVLKGQPPYLYDGGDQTRCFTFIDDAVEALYIMGHHPDALGEAFNVGFPEEHTIASVIATIIDQAGVDIEPEPVDTRQKYGAVYEDIDRRVPSVSKIRDKLGWEATTGLTEGIRRTIDWARTTDYWLDIKVEG